MSIKDVADKVDWEGGVIAAIDWGISSEDIDNQSLAKLWAEVENAYAAIDLINQILHSPVV